MTDPASSRSRSALRWPWIAAWGLAVAMVHPGCPCSSTSQDLPFLSITVTWDPSLGIDQLRFSGLAATTLDFDAGLAVLDGGVNLFPPDASLEPPKPDPTLTPGASITVYLPRRAEGDLAAVAVDGLSASQKVATGLGVLASPPIQAGKNVIAVQLTSITAGADAGADAGNPDAGTVDASFDGGADAGLPASDGGVCDFATCPDGCCNGTTCETGTTPQFCGTGGSQCQTCQICYMQQCCSPNCGTAACGADDGCGGKCPGICPMGFTCIVGTCVLNGDAGCGCGPGACCGGIGAACCPSQADCCGSLCCAPSAGTCCPGSSGISRCCPSNCCCVSLMGTPLCGVRAGADGGHCTCPGA
jgi:hypothetical protein